MVTTTTPTDSDNTRKKWATEASYFRKADEGHMGERWQIPSDRMRAAFALERIADALEQIVKLSQREPLP